MHAYTHTHTHTHTYTLMQWTGQRWNDIHLGTYSGIWFPYSDVGQHDPVPWEHDPHAQWRGEDAHVWISHADAWRWWVWLEVWFYIHTKH